MGDVFVCVVCAIFHEGIDSIGTADEEGWVWDFLTLWDIGFVLGTCGWDLLRRAYQLVY